MADPRFEKAPDAFRTISEVAEELALPQHVLRFWETRFGQIKPLKRGGGRRYYRPDDVDLLRGIKHLLYGEGYTIKGVQRILKAQGLKFVQTIWRDPGAPIPDFDRDDGVLDEEDADEAPEPLRPAVETRAPAPEPDPVAAPLFARHAPTPMARAPMAAPTPVPTAPRAPAPTAPEPMPAGDAPFVLARPPEPKVDTPVAYRRANSEQLPEPAGLAREDVRRLQSALFELIEAKKLIDAMR